ncbi:hypothetical protein [Sphingopyxis sp. 22461]|uniref:DUF5983 family protein n=1 Tax=Sphingopyxis sp. 22461 TaxID=3453923 RepID=UPI003F8283A6
MSEENMRAFAQLLARARAAFETATDLDDAAREALIEDISAFEDCLVEERLPWPIEVYIGTIDHRHGVNHYVALTRGHLIAEIADYCREWWAEIDDRRDPAQLDDETVADRYFDDHPSEYLVTDRVRIEPIHMVRPLPDVEAGRYCVLSTAHLSTATATLLTKWCADAGPDRPINVASTLYGWFVPTRENDEATGALLPADLSKAMQYGRSGGFDHILFDCDASGVDSLPAFDW